MPLMTRMNSDRGTSKRSWPKSTSTTSIGCLVVLDAGGGGGRCGKREIPRRAGYVQ